MRGRSITGPVLLVVIGLLFLVNNVWRDIPFWSLVWNYWPVLLILIGGVGLVEALYHASRGVEYPPRPFAGAGIFWIVMLVAFFSWAGHGNIRLGPFANGGISVLGKDFGYDVKLNGKSEGVTRVVLDGLRGNVSLKGQQGGDVSVTGHKTVRAFSKTDADRADQQSPIRIERQGDLLIVRAEDPSNTHSLSVSSDLEITIPRGLDVEARAKSGDLTVDDIAGDVTVINGKGDVRLSNIGKDVRVETSSRGGLIRASDVKGKVDLKGHGGDVQIENVLGEVNISGEYFGTLEFHALSKTLHFQSESSDFRMEAVPGSITMDSGDLKMSNVTGPVRYKTSTRDVTATDITNGLEISVNRGDIEVTETKTPLPKLDLHSHHGNVTLAIPEKADFDLDGKTGQGDVNNDFGDALKTDQSGHSATIKGKQGAGPDVRVGTDRGTLTVKKS